MYVATITVPGEYPPPVDPPTFDKAEDAWCFLADQRMVEEDNHEPTVDRYSEAVDVLMALLRGAREAAYYGRVGGTGSVYAYDPAWDGEPGDNPGVIYTVAFDE